MNQLTIDDAIAAGHDCAARALDKAQRADNTFAERAKAFMLEHLKNFGDTSGEDLTDACKAAGIRPQNDDRAFGGVFLSLSNPSAPRIRCIRSDLPRKYGHGTSGGRLWGLVQ